MHAAPGDGPGHARRRAGSPRGAEHAIVATPASEHTTAGAQAFDHLGRVGAGVDPGLPRAVHEHAAEPAIVRTGGRSRCSCVSRYSSPVGSPRSTRRLSPAGARQRARAPRPPGGPARRPRSSARRPRGSRGHPGQRVDAQTSPRSRRAQDSPMLRSVGQPSVLGANRREVALGLRETCLQRFDVLAAECQAGRGAAGGERPPAIASEYRHRPPDRSSSANRTRRENARALAVSLNEDRGVVADARPRF